VKITCTKCGHQNELGRVFCTGCGKKLDLTHNTSMEEIKPNVFLMWLKFSSKIALWVVLGAGILGVALAFWPAPASTQLGENRGGTRVEQKAKALRGGTPGVALQASFTERDLNTWLDTNKGRGGYSIVAIRLLEGRFIIKGQGFINLPFTVPGLPAQGIPYSMGMSGRFIGGRLQVSSRVMGHLPLFGPLTGIVDRRLRAVLGDLVDAELIVAVREVLLTEGQVQVTVQK
jgi:hypothetical protein